MDEGHAMITIALLEPHNGSGELKMESGQT